MKRGRYRDAIKSFKAAMKCDSKLEQACKNKIKECEEKKNYNNLKRIIENILLGEDPKDAYTLEEQQTKCEVIDLVPHKKRG